MGQFTLIKAAAKGLEMYDTDDLLAIADEIERLQDKFLMVNWGRQSLRAEDENRLNGLVVEAVAIIKDHLGVINDFTLKIADETRMNGMVGGATQGCVSNVQSIIRGAARHINRKVRSPAPGIFKAAEHAPYVALSRIAEIQSLGGRKWDFAKLAQLCKELNAVSAKECHFATAMLVRAITDHVPPVFGVRSFGEVVSNYPGTKSFKGSIEYMHRSLRNIADGMLHEQIRAREVLPSPQQVDFRAALDLLLSEIVRIA